MDEETYKEKLEEGKIEEVKVEKEEKPEPPGPRREERFNIEQYIPFLETLKKPKTKELQAVVVAFATNCATGDGKHYFHIGKALDGMNLIYCHAEHITAGATGNPTLIQIHNLTDTNDMLSTRIMVDVGETGSDTAATAYVIDKTKDDVVENDLLRVDVDQLPTTVPKGLIITLGFRKPYPFLQK